MVELEQGFVISAAIENAENGNGVVSGGKGNRHSAPESHDALTGPQIVSGHPSHWKVRKPFTVIDDLGHEGFRPISKS